MKPTDTLTTLFEHHLWANLRLLERCAELTPEQLAATIPGAYGTIHETFQHITRAEQTYFSRISTGQPRPSTPDLPLMTMEEMAESLQRTGSGLIEWAGKIQPGDTVHYESWYDGPRDVPTTIILTQVINHATEHREQIKAIMTEIGVKPPELQAWAYLEAMDDE